MSPFIAKATAALYFLSPIFLQGASSLVAPPAVVGKNLETAVSVVLSEPALDDGIEITLRSADPTKLRIAKGQADAGAESLTLKVRQGYRESPEFWLQGLSDSGTVNYTATAMGFSSATGVVTLTPSALIMIGPMRAPKFLTTTGAGITKVTVSAGRLDSALQFVEEQPVAGGRSVKAEVVSSKSTVGVLASNTLEIRGGTSSEATYFKPGGEGETVFSLKPPSGFSTPAQYATLTALVRKPGLAVADQMSVGQNLEVFGVLSLGEAAPVDGLKVTLKSDDPAKVLLSASATTVGTPSITLTVPADASSANYYIQALGGSGTVTYTASAPGYRSRTGEIMLTPSGVMLTPAAQGPPDEAQVLRKEAPDGTHHFYADVSKPAATVLVAWTAQLDPITHHGADITVQPLRAGMKLSLTLTNTKPEVGKVTPSVVIEGGADHGVIDFTPLSVGTTEITVVTPKDFTPSGNSTTVVAFVRK